jgi:hypothetical protein
LQQSPLIVWHRRLLLHIEVLLLLLAGVWHAVQRCILCTLLRLLLLLKHPHVIAVAC